MLFPNITRWIVICVLLACWTAGPIPAHAWKLDTHYWLANEVLNELLANGGHVTIPARSTYPIPPSLFSAISHHRGDYLIGVLGPDTYPDMVAGQMTTHPGLEAVPGDAKEILPAAQQLLTLARRSLHGPLWGTDDWLQLVRTRALRPLAAGESATVRERELAFAYGYLTHAAMDMWAHSYVNLYAGDVFSFMDEQEVEFRHMAIETFVKRTHQSIFSVPAAVTQDPDALQLRDVLRNPFKLALSPQDSLTKITAPVGFVRSTLILNAQAANQYAREISTLHLLAMYVYWAEVGEIRAKLQPLRTLVNTAAQDADRKVREAEIAFDAADAALRATGQAYSVAYDAFKAAEKAALDAESALDRAIQDTRRTFGLGSNTDSWPPPAKAAIKLAQDALQAAHNVLAAARNEYNRQKDKRDRLQADQERALRNADTERAARQAVRQMRDQSLNLIDGGVRAWQEGVEDAVDAYILSWEDTSKELMRPPDRRVSPGGDVTEPLKQWATCWGPTFGLPVLTQIAPVCQKARTNYLTAADHIHQLLQNTLIPKPIRDALEDLEEQASRAVQLIVPEAAKMISATIRIDNGAIAGYARSIVNLRLKEPTTTEIDAEFADDISGKRLVTFPTRFTALLYQDMGLPIPPADQPHMNKSLADLRNFAALENAFTMAKLVLLAGGELNRLTIAPSPLMPAPLRESQGVLRTLPPPKPYDLQAPAGEILIGAVKSIDGDHQWQRVAPKLPRKLPIDCSRSYPPKSVEAHYCTPRVFGYDASVQGKTGLLLWRDTDLRQTVFNRIFQGPLTPGLVTALGPQMLSRGIGLCPADPFPPTDGPDICRDGAPQTGQPLRHQGRPLPPVSVPKPLPRTGP